MRYLHRAWAAAVLLSAPALGQSSDDSRYVSPWRTPWTYTGPRGADHWSELDPDYAACNVGKEQSPIDIQASQKATNLPALRFEYVSEPIKYVVNNGHTIRVDYHDAPGVGSYLIVGEKRYQLTQLHFHRPSEEYVRGRRYDMVLHLMHKSSDGEAIGVAVLLKRGRANPTVAALWQHMPPEEGKEPVPGLALDPAGMLPPRLGYYTYMGSVTAPPCTEGVRWFILKSPLEVSAAQIQAFSALYPADVRPLQPLGARTVMESP